MFVPDPLTTLFLAILAGSRDPTGGRAPHNTCRAALYLYGRRSASMCCLPEYAGCILEVGGSNQELIERHKYIARTAPSTRSRAVVVVQRPIVRRSF
ncbi:hypothetical protein BV25DRAFT_420234 [Artomyces pyxidatus]|uniref:Uncharacterized protein n=1 Tax=Artomyces pyxidatus TaxID=48021 RepID=A0ACB8T4H5_9AGAM|nr:hypothetical protein BV25DRAFT_420234 [Artomyces pyxidatus]